MKILYFGNQRLDAQNLATALRTVARNGTVSWTSSLDRAAKWLDENRDVAALVVEAQTDGATGASVLKHVRDLALRPALVVVVPEGAGTRLGPLAAAADELIDKNSARFRDLPAVVTAAVARVRGATQLPTQPTPAVGTPGAIATAREVPAPDSDDRGDFERKLTQATAALREAEHKHQKVMAALSEQLAERQVQYDLAMARATARWQIVDEQLRTAAIEAESARRDHAAAAADLEQLKHRDKELASQLTDAAANNDTLANRLADAEAALEAARTRAAQEQAAAAEQFAARQRELQAQIAAEVDERRTLEATLAQTVSVRDDLEARHLSAMAEAAAQARELNASLRRSQDGHTALAKRLADSEAALRAAHARAAQEQAAAAEQLAARERELQAQIAAAREERHQVEATLAETVRARDDAEARHAAAMAEAAAQAGELNASLRRSQDGNDALAKRLAESEAALQAAHKHAAQEQVAAAEQLAARQRDHESQMAVAAEERRQVEATLAQAVRARDESETRRAAAMMDAAAQLRELDAALRLARDGQATTAAEVERLTAREAELNAALAGVTATHNNLERRLAATEAAFKDADTRATSERLDMAKRAAAREAELDGQIRQERAKSASLETAMADAEAALRAAGEERESALAKAAAELAEHQTRLSNTAADRDRIKQTLANIEAALERSRAEHQSAVADVERLSQRETELVSQVADVSSARANVEAARQKLDAELTEARSAIDKATSREAELESRIQQESAARGSLEQAVADREAALREARQHHDEALAKAAQELSDRQAEFAKERSEAQAARARLTERLAEVEHTVERLRCDHESATADVARLTEREAALVSQLADTQSVRQKLELELADAIEKAASREAALDEALRGERATSAKLERAIADGEQARRDDQKQHEAKLAAAASELAAHLARFDRELSAAAADRDRLNVSIAELERTLEQARTDHQSARADVARLTQREADLTKQIADVQAARQSLEGKLEEAVKTIAAANAQAARDRTQAAQRAAKLESALAAEIDARTAVARELDETRAAALDAKGAAERQADQLRATAWEQKTAFEAQLAQERQEHETRLAADLRAAREQFDRARAAADADIARLIAALEESGRALEKARSEFHTGLERRDSDHAAVLAARHDEIKQLHHKITTVVAELDGTRRTLAAVRAEAEKLPSLRKDLEESRSESARLFQQAGLAMFRCTRRGELAQTNRAGMTLVGRRTIDELRGDRFATSVFEDPNGLSFLIERCVSSRTRESIETTWRRKDGGRLFVRLSAYASSPDVIEIVAEDLTRVRVLQERLGQANRMEAVGRLASEVAVTCGNLLTDVQHDVQQWLASAGESASTRQHGEHLLAELTRATGFLRQLAAYGDEQARTPAMADLNTVVRDLEPVLKRVAGDSVDVHVSDASSRLNVDVGAERIERLLVNLASFGRARMPHGGQLKIELGTTVVDRRFVAKHPNVRLGPHALITVTESRHTRKNDALLQLRESNPAHRPPAEKPDQKPGMDFGTLQGLVGGCGGHLWMTVQPQGDMVAKIHLPLQAPFEQAAPRVLALRGVRDRALARLFHH